MEERASFNTGTTTHSMLSSRPLYILSEKVSPPYILEHAINITNRKIVLPRSSNTYMGEENGKIYIGMYETPCHSGRPESVFRARYTIIRCTSERTNNNGLSRSIQRPHTYRAYCETNGNRPNLVTCTVHKFSNNLKRSLCGQTILIPGKTGKTNKCVLYPQGVSTCTVFPVLGVTRQTHATTARRCTVDLPRASHSTHTTAI